MFIQASVTGMSRQTDMYDSVLEQAQLVIEFPGCIKLCSRVICILFKLLFTCIFFINIDFSVSPLNDILYK